MDLGSSTQSDIFEEDEVEVEISNILPSSPQTSTSSATSSMLKRPKKKLLVPTILIDIAVYLRSKLHRPKLLASTTSSSISSLDLSN
ncbi:hypothetical protein NLI96_g9020 [Meripilus lineatus]|uniref:Uncharacterized protein n=1 Tax=Meripilus lineatus TaxID=2056292 RepID=A0AAD5UXY4_9APHY|nr:hypothetical protein NLI96_g9020 [Physisporinus lineatus]